MLVCIVFINDNIVSMGTSENWFGLTYNMNKKQIRWSCIVFDYFLIYNVISLLMIIVSTLILLNKHFYEQNSLFNIKVFIYILTFDSHIF